MKSFMQRVNVWMLIANIVVVGASHAATYTVTRLNDGQPILTESMFVRAGAAEQEGENLNGPSMIRVPDWIDAGNRADPSAVYYLYFANHRGNYIRMAWAAALEGPWHLYRTGTGIPVGGRGVLDLGYSDDIDIGNNITVAEHVASPEVIVDDVNQRIIMYFHAPTYYDGSKVDQRSFAATSPYGLDFNDRIEPVMLGSSYFRVFEANGNMYAFANSGALYKSLDPADPWTAPPGFDFSEKLWDKLSSDENPFVTDIAEAGLEPLRLRHPDVHIVGDSLQVFITRKEDYPERILMSTIDLTAGDFDLWDATWPSEELLSPEMTWEGGDLDVAQSDSGPAPENVPELRDAHIFEDIDGTVYMLYAGRGEDAIGLARLDVDTGEPDTVRGVRLFETWNRAGYQVISDATPGTVGSGTVTADRQWDYSVGNDAAILEIKNGAIEQTVSILEGGSAGSNAFFMTSSSGLTPFHIDIADPVTLGFDWTPLNQGSNDNRWFDLRIENAALADTGDNVTRMRLRAQDRYGDETFRIEVAGKLTEFDMGVVPLGQTLRVRAVFMKRLMSTDVVFTVQSVSTGEYVFEGIDRLYDSVPGGFGYELDRVRIDFMRRTDGRMDNIIVGAALDEWGDHDGDGLAYELETSLGTDPLVPDTDDDGMYDGWELENALDPLNDDAALDLDSDLLSNVREYTYSTDPNNPDSDDDGYTDGQEIERASDPLNADDSPVPWLAAVSIEPNEPRVPAKLPFAFAVDGVMIDGVTADLSEAYITWTIEHGVGEIESATGVFESDVPGTSGVSVSVTLDGDTATDTWSFTVDSWASVSIGTGTIRTNDAVSIPVTLDAGGADVMETGFTLTFDPAVLDMVDIEKAEGGASGEISFEATYVDDGIYDIFIGADDVPLAPGDIAAILFRAPAAGRNGTCSTLAVSEPVCYDVADTPVTISGEDGACCIEFTFPLGDINRSGRVDAADLQLVINAALDYDVVWYCDVNDSGKVDAGDVQLVVNALLGIDIRNTAN